jgi:hypothetical protein
MAVGPECEKPFYEEKEVQHVGRGPPRLACFLLVLGIATARDT